jgi:hypothetical protein
MSAPIPIIATGVIYAPYIEAARSNIEAMRKMTRAYRDTVFAREADFILDSFNDAVADAEAMIAEANTPDVVDKGQHWRSSMAAEFAGLAE